MTTTAGKLLLLMGQAIQYLFHDEFSVAQAAPMPATFAAYPGPGLLVRAVDTANKASISGGNLIIVGKGTFSDPCYYIADGSGTTFSRKAGRVFIASFQFPAVGGLTQYIGSFKQAGMTATDCALYLSASTINYNGSFNSTLLLTNVAVLANTPYQLAIVERGTGYFMFLKGDVFTDWTLLWVDVNGVIAPPFMGAMINAGTMNIDYMRCRELSAPFLTDFGIATLNVASPVDSTLYTGDADGSIAMTIANITALTICGFKYRYLDVNNYWYVYIDAAGHFKVDSVVAGIPTNRVDVAGVASIGDALTLRVIVDGTKHNFYTLKGSTWTKRGAEINVSTSGDSAATVVPVIGANWTPTNLNGFAQRSPQYNQLSVA